MKKKAILTDLRDICSHDQRHEHNYPIRKFQVVQKKKKNQPAELCITWFREFYEHISGKITKRY